MQKSFEKLEKLFIAYKNVVKLADEIILSGNKSQEKIMEYRRARIELTTLKKK